MLRKIGERLIPGTDEADTVEVVEAMAPLLFRA